VLSCWQKGVVQSINIRGANYCGTHDFKVLFFFTTKVMYLNKRLDFSLFLHLGSMLFKKRRIFRSP